MKLAESLKDKYSDKIYDGCGRDAAMQFEVDVAALLAALAEQPAQRKPLTDEQVFEISNGLALWMFPVETRVTDRELAFARAIEAAHGIKENT